MKKQAGILVSAIIASLILFSVCALGESVYDSFGGEFRNEVMTEGFSVPIPADTDMFRFDRNADHYLTCRSTDASAPNRIYIDYYIFDPLKEYAEDSKSAEAVYDAQHYESNAEYQSENISIGKHIARAHVYREKADSGDCSVGILHYVRNNRMLQVRLYSEPQNGTAWEDLPKVTTDDLRKLAEQIGYDPEMASARKEDGEFVLSAKGGTNTLAAGKKITVTAEFIHPDKVNREAGNDGIKWSVQEEESGKKIKGLSIDKKGEVSAPKQITEATVIKVKAESTVFHTSATLSLTILPVMNGISVEPAKIVLYTGAGTPATVRAVPNPKTIPPTGITWSSQKKGIVRIEANPEDGTAEILPENAGNTVITVKEPGGKKAKMTVEVLRSVEDIELSASGKAVPGKMVVIKEKIIPQNAGNTNVKWSLDVDTNIATIDRGALRISKDAPVGTVITVTCTAEGAPEPVVRTIEIKVVKK